MTKPERLSLIERLCRFSDRPALNALPSEIREEAALAAKHNDDQSIVDEDVITEGLSPELARALAPTKRTTHAKQDDLMLTAGERAQLAKDLANHRLACRIELDLLCARADTPYALIPYAQPVRQLAAS